MFFCLISNSEKRYDEYALKTSVKNYFETQNLQLSNIILLAQQFNELILTEKVVVSAV